MICFFILYKGSFVHRKVAQFVWKRNDYVELAGIIKFHRRSLWLFTMSTLVESYHFY